MRLVDMQEIAFHGVFLEGTNIHGLFATPQLAYAKR